MKILQSLTCFANLGAELDVDFKTIIKMNKHTKMLAIKLLIHVLRYVVIINHFSNNPGLIVSLLTSLSQTI